MVCTPEICVTGERSLGIARGVTVEKVHCRAWKGIVFGSWDALSKATVSLNRIDCKRKGISMHVMAKANRREESKVV